jgi:hypothetical protein
MYSTVNTEKLKQAFVKAHFASERIDISDDARNQFRIIAHLIWDAHEEEETDFPTTAQIERALVKDTR